jgi:iron complex outermembrane receptor protein
VIGPDTAGVASDAAPAPASSSPATASDSHNDRDQAILVTGIRRRAQDVLGGVSVLDEEALARELRPSLGETLARLPGVSSTSFGPVAASPVLRGLSGDRVRVLTDGIGTLDLSTSGPDHAVAINPITAERIEVLRGPSALLFGSSAIGGVVNVVDTRIPRRQPEGSIAGAALAQFGTAADERSGNLSLNVPVGRFVLHADGNLSRTDDLRTGGYILSRDLRDQARASDDPAIQALADLKGRLPNSAARSREGALGAAYVFGGVNVGASISRHEQKYQVPIRYALEPGGEAEAPTIDQRQTRYDARAEAPIGGFFSQVRARGGYANYRHDELEESGEIGTSFFSKGGEGRLELIQTDRSGWGGTSGVQYLERNARIRGEEKFLPDNRQRQTGLFTLQTLVDGPLRAEAGARVEFSQLSAQADEQLQSAERSRRFTALSGSLGGQYEFVPGWQAGLSLSHSERAPAIDELFANGPHGASQSFERGDPGIERERSNSVELTLRRTTGPVHLTANLYHSRFSSFIFQAPIDEVEDDLPVYEYRQDRARFSGIEVSGDARIGRALGIDWTAELQADAVRATVKNFGPAPFIPPVRLLGAIAGSRGALDGRLEVEKAFAHERTAPNETDTRGYTMVNAALE